MPLSNRGLKFGIQFPLKFLIPLLLRTLGACLLIFALCRPQTSSTHSRKQTDGIDIVFTLDLSDSMVIIDDLKKKLSRIETAKQVMKEFVKGRTDDRIGLVVFSGEAVTLCPPTLDYDVLLQALDSSSVDLLYKEGTAIGDGLAAAVNRLKNSTAKSKIVILLTDGDNNVGAVAPLTAGDMATGYGIKVYSIAFGKEGIVNLPKEVPTFFGGTKHVMEQIDSTINPELLMKISKETNGKFYRADDLNTLKNVFDDINRLEKNKVETKSRVLWNEEYQIYLLIGLIFLLLDLALRTTVFRILPHE